MNQSRRQDRKLDEVRGVLHRLQGLPVERQPADPRTAERGFRRGYLVGIAGTTTVIVTAAMVLVFGFVLPDFRPEGPPAAKEATPVPKDPTPTPKEAPKQPPPSSKAPAAPGVPTGSAGSPKDRPDASATVNPAVEAAQQLIGAGQVQAARQRLLAMAPEGSPEVAWALARSYDPNHLKGIEGADAGPDVAEATRWYRAWYAAAVKQRMITDGVSLEKIIGSMQP